MQRLATCAFFALSILASSCERRVEEPAPPPRPTQAAEVVVPPAPTDSVEAPVPPELDAPVAKVVPPKGRCVKPTPPRAERPLKKGADPRCPADDEANPPKLPLGHVRFHPFESKDHADIDVEVELAKNEHDHTRGLMFRKSMPENHGMLFLFPTKDNKTFWMHNTCIPLDMLFIDDDGLIVGIEENCPTLDDDTFQVGCTSRYVLEMNAGWARAHGVQAGQFAKLDL